MRILFLTARPPWPPRRGDQLRSGGLAEALAARHEVRVVAQRWPGFDAGEPPPGVALETVPVGWPELAAAVRHGFGRPLQVALHRQRAFAAAVERRAASFRPDVAVVVLSRTAAALGGLAGVPVVLDLVDALGLNMARRAARQGLLAPLFRWEARRMTRWDREAVDAAEVATVVAERDRRALVESGVPPGKVRVLPLGLRLGPTPTAPAERRPIVALTGNLGYFPTVDGARWLAREAWPRVRAAEPRAELWLAGARPAPPVRRLARLPGVRLHADPDDLGEVLRRAAVAVAPLRSGSGTPIKILEAMAAGVPVVTTGDGRAGLDGLPAGAVRVADDGEAFAGAVVELLRDPEAGRRQARTARRWLEDRHDLGAVAARFEALLEEVVSQTKGESPPRAGSK